MSELKALVRRVVGGNPAVMAAFVFDQDGRVEAADGTDSEMLAAAVALFVPMRDLLERTTASLGCGEMESTLVQGSKATIGVSDIDGLRAVALMGNEAAPAGALLQDALWLAHQLREAA